MNVDAVTALYPVQHANSPALGPTGHRESNVPAHHGKAREEFVFLGYGQGYREGPYNGFGRAISQKASCGATVDIYI